MSISERGSSLSWSLGRCSERLGCSVSALELLLWRPRIILHQLSFARINSKNSVSSFQKWRRGSRRGWADTRTGTHYSENQSFATQTSLMGLVIEPSRSCPMVSKNCFLSKELSCSNREIPIKESTSSLLDQSQFMSELGSRRSWWIICTEAAQSGHTVLCWGSLRRLRQKQKDRPSSITLTSATLGS